MSSRDILMSANVTFWMADLGRVGVNDFGQGVAFDNIGNVYVLGYFVLGANNFNWVLAKYSPEGSLIWQKTIANATGIPAFGDESFSITVSGGNIYASGLLYQKLCVIKFDLDGTVVWKFSIDYPSGVNTHKASGGLSLVVDQTGNVYFTAGDPNNGPLFKLNSSGVLQWQINISAYFGNSGRITSIAINPPKAGFAVTQLIYVNCTSFPSGGNAFAGLIKFDLNGVQVTPPFGVTLSGATQTYGLSSAISTPSPFRYSCFAADNTSFYVKSETTWHSRISGFSSDTITGTFGKMQLDQDENVYSSICISNVIYMFKHNSAGTLIWQRSISLQGGFSLTLSDLTVDNYGNLYIAGSSSVVEQSSSRNLFIAKVPTNGSLTGTYALGAMPNGNVVYAASSLTVSASSGTLFTGAITAATTAYTTGVPATTIASSTALSKTVII